MSRRRRRFATMLAVFSVAATATAGASAKPILMPTLTSELQAQHQVWAQHVFAPVGKLQPPAPPCPENGTLPAPFSNCGLPEFPATTLPYPGNMAYYGGHVQTEPTGLCRLLGLGREGRFPGHPALHAEKITEGAKSTILQCDPDGAGGTWPTGSPNSVAHSGRASRPSTTSRSPTPTGHAYNEHVTNPDRPARRDSGPTMAHSITGLPKTSASNPAGPTNTYTDLAAEAARAVSHFHITDLANANIVIAQPAQYSDPNALSTGYCAFHDYTYPGVQGGIYNGVTKGISYTNMPYALAINSSGANVCGKNAVNPGTAGKLDGFSIVLGHEIEETVTDPGAEDVIGTGSSAQTIGGWYDSLDANENGDKCAWVGETLGLPGEPTVTPVPGAINDVKGNRGRPLRRPVAVVKCRRSRHRLLRRRRQ